MQILKDILASFEGGEESDASEVSDSVPSDDGSDAMSVEEGDAETLPTGTRVEYTRSLVGNIIIVPLDR